jgi:hypothetical protein
MKDEIFKTIENIQKSIFSINIPIENLILLNHYPTNKVNSFYEEIEKIFSIKFEERPDTITEIVSLIKLNLINKSQWK